MDSAAAGISRHVRPRPPRVVQGQVGTQDHEGGRRGDADARRRTEPSRRQHGAQVAQPHVHLRNRLDRSEIRTLVAALPAIARVFQALVILLLLTGQRLREVAGMRWEEIDLERDEWIIPATRTRNKLRHLVPITRQMRAIMMRMSRGRTDLRGLVLTTNGRTPISGFSKAKEAPDMAVDALAGAGVLPGWVAGTYNLPVSIARRSRRPGRRGPTTSSTWSGTRCTAMPTRPPEPTPIDATVQFTRASQGTSIGTGPIYERPAVGRFATGSSTSTHTWRAAARGLPPNTDGGPWGRP